MRKIKPVTISEVEEIAHVLAQKKLNWDEPIPAFNTRRPYVLESCLAVPFQSFGNRELYIGLVGKASALFYLLVKNHPFKNGNKRVAITTLLIFLAKNGKWLKVNNVEFYNFAKWVAESNPKFKDQTIAAIEKFIDIYMVKI